MKLFELFATLSLDTKNFESGIKAAANDGKALGDQLTGIIAKGTAAGNAMYNFGRQALSALFQTGKDLVQTAADVKAQTAAYESTFKGLKGSANEAFKAVADDTNILATRLRTVGTKAFSQFKGAGMDASTALQNMETYLRLAADGAAYYDMSMEEVDERLRSFLRGNTEAGDQIGLFTSELQRNNKALELYDKKWDKLNEAQRQMVMLDIVEDIYGQSNVIGQAAKEGDAYANVMANLKENIALVMAKLGTPVVEHLTPFLGKVSDFMTKNPELFDSLANVLGTIASTTFDTLEAGLEWIEEHSDEIAAAFDAIAAAIKNAVDWLGLWVSGQAHAELTQSGLGYIEKTAEDFAENPGQVIDRLNTPLAQPGASGVSVGDLLIDWVTGGKGSTLPKNKSGAPAADTTWYDDSDATPGMSAPGFSGKATGLHYVPYDNFRTRLHRGERVLTAREAEEFDEQRQHGYSAIDYDRIAEATSQRPVVVYVDKKAAAVLLSRDMDTAIGNRNIRQLVSMGG